MSHAVVITVSDSCARGERADLSGPEARGILEGAGFTVQGPQVVADDRGMIAAALREAAAGNADLVVTTGGTGLGPRDVTPEATLDVIEREAPGIADHLRQRGLAETPFAALSRGRAGLVASCLIVNLPGSPRAVRADLEALLPLLPHALAVASGGVAHS